MRQMMTYPNTATISEHVLYSYCLMSPLLTNLINQNLDVILYNKSMLEFLVALIVWLAGQTHARLTCLLPCCWAAVLY